MAESLVNVTEGAGKKLHTWQTTIGANNVEDEFVLPAEYPYPSYTAYYHNVSIATANDHLAQLMAGATLNVRIRRIRIEQNANATAAARADFQLLRLTTAGTGGTAVTPSKLDTADAAAGAAGIIIPGVKGTESTVIRDEVLIMRQAIATTQTQPEETIEWTWFPSTAIKSLKIPAGAANGIAIKNIVAIAGATVDITIEFVEQAF